MTRLALQFVHWHIGRLNELFPSKQRATILSVSSLLFSLMMIALSPLAGWLFGGL